MTEPVDSPISDTTSKPASEAELLEAIERAVRATKKAYGYQHLSAISNTVREQYPSFSLADYGCKNWLQLIERYPERFKIKHSAPAHPGKSRLFEPGSKLQTAS